MTIIWAARSAAFAVIGTDQLAREHLTNEASFVRKVTLHPKLPIAMAPTGIADVLRPEALRDLPDPRTSPREWGDKAKAICCGLPCLLEERLSTYAPSRMTAAQVADDFARWLHPALLEMERFNNVDLDDLENCTIRLIVLTMNGNAAEAVHIHVGRQISPTASGDFLASGPEALREHLKPRLMQLAMT